MAPRTNRHEFLKARNENYRFPLADYLRTAASQGRLTSLAMSVTERSLLADANYGILISYFMRKYVE